MKIKGQKVSANFKNCFAVLSTRGLNFIQLRKT